MGRRERRRPCDRAPQRHRDRSHHQRYGRAGLPVPLPRRLPRHRLHQRRHIGRKGPSTMNHPLDEEIAALIAQLLPLLRERGIRHMSLFSDDQARIYLAAGDWRNEIKADGASAAEALAALDAAVGESLELETLY